MQISAYDFDFEGFTVERTAIGKIGFDRGFLKLVLYIEKCLALYGDDIHSKATSPSVNRILVSSLWLSLLLR